MDKLHNVNTMETPTTLPEIKEEINFDTFSALDLRVGTILAAQKVPKTDKLCSLRWILVLKTHHSLWNCGIL